ncbi:unnamed protein product, partial [Prunus brigantina]
SILPCLFEFENVFSKHSCQGFFFFMISCKLHPFAQKNLDENVLHLFENTLVLGPHWFGHVPEEMALLFKGDAEAPLCFPSSSALASHTLRI